MRTDEDAAEEAGKKPNWFNLGIRLLGENLAVIRNDWKLVAFPLLAAAAIAIISGAIWTPLFYITNLDDGRLDYVYLLIAFGIIVFFVSYFLIYLMDAALVHYFTRKLDGEEATVTGSTAYAWGHAGKIFVWASMSGSVGLFLRGLAKIVGLPYFLAKRALGRLTGDRIGVAWHSMISLGMPVMVFEDYGVKRAIRKSGDMARETWGEDISNARASISWIFWVVGAIGLVPLVLASLTGNGVIITIACTLVLDFWLILGSFCSSMNNLFAVSLYHYVNRGDLPPFYSPELIEDPFKRKSSRQGDESEEEKQAVK